MTPITLNNSWIQKHFSNSMIKFVIIEEHWSISLVTMFTFLLVGFVTCNMLNNLLPMKKAAYGIWDTSSIHHVKHKGSQICLTSSQKTPICWVENWICVSQYISHRFISQNLKAFMKSHMKVCYPSQTSWGKIIM